MSRLSIHDVDGRVAEFTQAAEHIAPLTDAELRDACFIASIHDQDSTYARMAAELCRLRRGAGNDTLPLTT